MQETLNQIEDQKQQLLNAFGMICNFNRDELSCSLDKFNYHQYLRTSQECEEAITELTKLYHSWGPSGVFSGCTSRNMLKNYARKGCSVRDIDLLMKVYFSMQIDYLCQQMAFRFAFGLYVLMRESPNLLGFIILKRHEESNSVHKGFGFNSDTGLTAICMLKFAFQTEFDLMKLKQMHTFEMCLLHKYVMLHTLVSPVRRAYQTLFVTLDPDQLADMMRSVIVSHLVAEKSHWPSGKP